ncbi:MAG: hypothetical protein AABY01_01565, partial [Nanoarchaeota archaeon]
ALNYMKDDDLDRKFVVIGETEGAATVEYHLRELLSKHRLTRITAWKDETANEHGGRLLTVRARIALATTATSRTGIHDENATRFFETRTDESNAQTGRILEHIAWKMTGEGAEATALEFMIVGRHHSAQRLLRRVKVVIPYAKKIKFPANTMRSRRDYAKFMVLVKTIAFLRQFMHEILRDRDGHEYIEADAEDYRIAYELLVGGVLSSTAGELSAEEREFDRIARAHAASAAKERKLSSLCDATWIRREAREATGWSQKVVRRCIERLLDLELIEITRDVRFGQRHVYRFIDESAPYTDDFSMIPAPAEIAEWCAARKKTGARGRAA